MGVLVGYFYCRTGNYWLTVLIHSLLNTISGFVPALFLPKVNESTENLIHIINILSENVDTNVIVEELTLFLQEYGLILGLYVAYIGFLFVVNIIGVIFLILNFKKYKERKGEYSLPFKSALKTVFKTPGMIACTVFLVAVTVISLFS